MKLQKRIFATVLLFCFFALSTLAVHAASGSAREPAEACSVTGCAFVRTINASCWTGGWDTNVCSVCGAVEMGASGQPLTFGWRGALGHTWNEDTKVITQPTCWAGGGTFVSCTRCDHETIINWHGALGHLFGPQQPIPGNNIWAVVNCLRDNCSHSTFVAALPMSTLEGDFTIRSSTGTLARLPFPGQAILHFNNNNYILYFQRAGMAMNELALCQENDADLIALLIALTENNVGIALNIVTFSEANLVGFEVVASNALIDLEHFDLNDIEVTISGRRVDVVLPGDKTEFTLRGAAALRLLGDTGTPGAEFIHDNTQLRVTITTDGLVALLQPENGLRAAGTVEFEAGSGASNFVRKFIIGVEIEEL